MSEALRTDIDFLAILLLDLICEDGVVTGREGDRRDLLGHGEVEAAVVFPDHSESARRVALTVRNTWKAAIVPNGRVTLGGNSLSVCVLEDIEAVAMRVLATH
jgi:hypothetical protein